ncbi:MAG: aminotransferase class IV [Mariprofundaceae bacterium]
MSLTAYVNGQFIPLENAMIHIEDRGFQFADGVYEVVACYGGVYLDLEPHLERLERSCSAIGLSLPCPLAELQQLVKQCYKKNPFDDAMIYIQVTRGVAPRAHVVKEALTPTLVITSRQLPQPSNEKLEQGASVITLQDIRWKRCDIKSIALLASVIGKQEALQQDADEAFWLDENNHLLEGCSTNAFAVINNTLVTHPLDHQVLGGITRSMALRLARDNGISIEERAWSLDESGITECMMSSTTNAVFPVCQVNNQPIGDGKPGPVCRNLRKLIIDELASLKA